MPRAASLVTRPPSNPVMLGRMHDRNTLRLIKGLGNTQLTPFGQFLVEYLPRMIDCL